ncbi:hypothetical protein D3C86_1777670 [compost metagenome]
MRVAMRSARCASKALAEPATALASKAAVRVSPSRSRSLLLAAPSVPMATLTPACQSRSTGQKPQASLRLDSGQWITLLLLATSRARSSSSTWVMCTAWKRGPSRPSRARRARGRSLYCCRLCCTSKAVSCTCM